MVQNYCEIKKNKIYAEIFDELLDEELSMNNSEHNYKVKNYLEKKITNSDYIFLSENFTNREEILEDIILKITSDVANLDLNLQGNTLMMYADDNTMYELFYMEDLSKQICSDNLNEFGSITNIFLQPVCWGCGIFKSTYTTGELKSGIITKHDVAKIFIANFYHQGVMINQNSSMIEIEFTGEDPFKVLGNNFILSKKIELIGFNLVLYVEKSEGGDLNSPDKFNEIGTKLCGENINGRIFICILCPNTNKKFWNISISTIKNILNIMDNEEIQKKIYSYLENAEININPFYLIKKFLVK